MRGHVALTKARLHGHTPESVFLLVLDRRPATRGFLDAEQVLGLTGHPEIDIAPEDVPGTLDLRCIRGMQVHVCGDDAARVRAVAVRAKAFAPSEILAVTDGTIIRWRPKA